MSSEDQIVVKATKEMKPEGHGVASGQQVLHPFDRETCEKSSFKRIFIRNIHPKLTSAHIEKLFSKYGPVLDVSLFATRGYAFCEMKSADDSSRAVSALHKRQLLGRTLIVQPANNNKEIGGKRRPEPTRRQLDGKINAIKRKLNEKAKAAQKDRDSAI